MDQQRWIARWRHHTVGLGDERADTAIGSSAAADIGVLVHVEGKFG